MPDEPEVADHYSAQYGQFAAEVHAQVRQLAFGEDIGQNSWLTVDELERFSSWLELGQASHLLDVACGSGGPALHLARLTGCEVTGVELYEEAVTTANRMAAKAGLEARARFVEADASRPLPFESAASRRSSASTPSTISPTARLCLATGRACSDRVGGFSSPIRSR